MKNKSLMLPILATIAGMDTHYHDREIHIETPKHTCPICGITHYHNGGFCCAEHAQRYKTMKKQGLIK
jgi:hypothetical protein